MPISTGLAAASVAASSSAATSAHYILHIEQQQTMTKGDFIIAFCFITLCALLFVLFILNK